MIIAHISSSFSFIRRFVFLLCLLFILQASYAATCPCCTHDEGAHLHKGEKIELPVVSLFDGSEFDVSTVEEDRIAFLFWASWCPTCQKELSRPDELKKLFDKNGTFLVGVSLDYEIDSAHQFVKQYNVNFPNTAMSFDLVDQFKTVVILPKLVMVDKQGNVLSVSNPANHEQLANIIENSK